VAVIIAASGLKYEVALSLSRTGLDRAVEPGCETAGLATSTLAASGDFRADDTSSRFEELEKT
jgi:hypothetical protein